MVEVTERVVADNDRYMYKHSKKVYIVDPDEQPGTWQERWHRRHCCIDAVL
jgi:hypothetical protein